MEIGDRMKIPYQVVFSDWVKTTDNSWVARNAIAEISLEYQGRDAYDDDDWEVVLLLNINDLWLPGPLPEENPRDVHKFYRQINDQQRRDVFRGTRDECQSIVDQIMRGSI